MLRPVLYRHSRGSALLSGILVFGFVARQTDPEDFAMIRLPRLDYGGLPCRLCLALFTGFW
ncbi:MAG TPA: hypothetical protein VGF77_15915, partial [Allosphingosinicella sp.]